MLWVFPVITQRAVDNYMVLSQDMAILEVMIWIGAVFLTYYTLQVGRTLIVAKFQNFFERHLMTEFMKKIMSLPLNFFVNRSTGDLIFVQSNNIYSAATK